VRTATVIPDNERWLHAIQAEADLTHALNWAKTNAPNDTNTDNIIEKLTNGQT
jgi:hypothetical protein